MERESRWVPLVGAIDTRDGDDDHWD